METGISSMPRWQRFAIPLTTWRMTERSSFQISLASSRGLMNLSGASMPYFGSSQRASASIPQIWFVSARTIGW